MNETLIKEIIKCKLNIIESIIDSLPTKMAEEVKDLSRIVLEGANESFQEMKKQPAKKTKSENKLQSVSIE